MGVLSGCTSGLVRRGARVPRSHPAACCAFQPHCASHQLLALAPHKAPTNLPHRTLHPPPAQQAGPLATLKAFRQRLSSLLAQAEQFRGLLGDTWLPRVGAAICAAHYLEHQLREPQGVLLLAELQDAAPGQEGGASGGSQGADNSAGKGSAPAAAAGRLAGLIEREAAAFSALRKQWAYKLAKQAVEAFHQLFNPYK